MSKWRNILNSQLTVNPPRLSVEDAEELYDYADLNELMSAALMRRHSLVPGDEITYLVDRNINYTNICTINCHFCSFAFSHLRCAEGPCRPKRTIDRTSISQSDLVTPAFCCDPSEGQTPVTPA